MYSAEVRLKYFKQLSRERLTSAGSSKHAFEKILKVRTPGFVLSLHPFRFTLWYIYALRIAQYPILRNPFFFSLKHFGNFLLRHFGHWNVSIICLTVVLKLAITVLFSWPKMTSDRNDFIFFGHIKNVSVHDRKMTEKKTALRQAT